MSLVIPDACTLPTAERPLRLAEFDALFTTAVRAVDTPEPTHARLRLTGPAGLGETVRDLADREARCCSFFTFTVTSSPSASSADGEEVTLDIRVPERYADVLASLVDLAWSLASGRPSGRSS